MVYRFFFLLICILVFIAVRVSSQHSGVSFSYTLNAKARTSAGIYSKDGILIRTLWNGVTKEAGTYSGLWDGLDDEGVAVPLGSYKAKILSNNVQYIWEGVIGNNSTNKSGNSVYNEWDAIHAMAASGNYVYTAANYSEGPNGRPSIHKFHIKTPTTKLMLKGLPYSANIAAESATVCTDGNYVYWGSLDSWSSNANASFVFATRCSDDGFVNFFEGSSYKTGGNTRYSSVINSLTAPHGTSRHNRITGLAVQKTGNFLFVARQNLNTISVLNKTTGALITTISSLPAPRFLAFDSDNKLWVVSGDSLITKYSVNSKTGTITSDGVSIKGIKTPLAIAVSPIEDLLIVADGKTQQVKGFHKSTGAAIAGWTLGQLNGYLNSPTVTNDKFLFRHMSREFYYEGTFLCFQPDGSFWVGDPGTKRNQHFAANRTFISSIMFSPSSRSCGTDANNPARVFSDYMEYAVNYNSPFGNQCWLPSYNWAGNISLNYWAEFSNLRHVTTLLNGRTYAMTWSRSSSRYEVVELTNTGLRFTSLLIDNPVKLAADGSLIKHPTDNPAIFKKKQLTGFDGSNNPIWQGGTNDWSTPSAYTETGRTPVLTDKDPVSAFVTPTIPNGDVAENGAVVSFDEYTPTYFDSNGDGVKDKWGYASRLYHLGAIKNNQWLWRTAKATVTTFNSNGTKGNYSGDYPTDGRFDNGNGTNYPGGFVLTKGNSIFWNHHGEFWKQGQTNKWQHVDANTGLLLGIFGATRLEGSITDAPAKMAGNALSGSIAKVGNNYYVYHCDESDHGGVHRWKITGLNTIREQAILIDLKQSQIKKTTQH